MLEQHPENAAPREHDFMFLDTEIFLVGKSVREERKEMSGKRRVINSSYPVYALSKAKQGTCRDGKIIT
jgi:hypothetical protein